MKRIRISLLLKIFIPSALLLALFFGLIWLYVVPLYEQHLHTDRFNSSERVLAVVFSSLDRMRSQGSSLGLTDAVIRKRALKWLREFRYTVDDYEHYIWVHDLQAVMLMHPHQPVLEGSNLKEYHDSNGLPVFSTMNELVCTSGGGIIHYTWPRPDGTAAEDKISYVKLYQPWGWVVGSGVYLGDITKHTTMLRKRLLAGTSLTFFAGLVISLLIARRVNRPYQEMHQFVDRIADQMDGNNQSNQASESETDRAITTMQRLLDEARQAKEQAERANELKSSFVAMTAHDLRTPLANIAGLADLMLEDQESLTGYQQETVSLVSSAAHNLLQQINDLLDLSKIEAGKFELHYRVTDIDQVCTEIVRLADRQAAQKGIELRYLPAHPAVPALLCDPVRIRQIITNLVGNGIKFTSSGSVTVTLSCFESTSADSSTFTCPDGAIRAELQIVVEDTGIGIHDEKLSEIFDAYQQAERTTSFHFGGTGLGLAICSKLALLMGGTINVTSQPGKGSRFCVTLPVGMLPGASSACQVDAEHLSCQSPPEQP